MNRLFYLTALTAVVSFAACSKDDSGTDEPVETTKTTEEYLLDKAWVMEKITFVQDNQLYYYQLGGSNNTINYNNDSIVFNTGGDGMYYNASGASFAISWDWDDTEQTALSYTIYDYAGGHAQVGANQLVHLENVNVDDETLKYAEIYTNSNDASVISSVVRKTAP